MEHRKIYSGPALLSYGFRPFFLSAILFALVVVAMWWAVWRGAMTLSGPFLATDWHIHEMVFGYGAAVVAGFLFTAVPNWTGRLPTRGWPLALLLALWGAGRLAVVGGLGLWAAAVALIDQAFLLAVAAMIAREIIAGRNWRNLKVLIPVSLLWAANVVFHVEVATAGMSDFGRRLGLAVLVFLVVLIGGRIIPSFTRNWLVKRAAGALPVAFNRFDAVAVLCGAVALLAWVVAPAHELTGLAAAVAAVLHLIRCARWRGQATWPSPLLAMLHLAYLMVPAGLACLALSAFGMVASQSVAHLFGIAVIGGMTVAVMMRATMGHTGRVLVAGPALSASFLLVIAAAGLRSVGEGLVLAGWDGIDLSAGFWCAGFAILALRLGPWLVAPKR